MPDILTLRRERGDKIEKMQAITDKDESTAEDLEQFDSLEAEVKEIDAKIERAERVQKYQAENAEPIKQPTAEEVKMYAPAEPKTPKEKGTDFSRIARSLVMAKGSPLLAAQWASDQPWDNKEEIAKALGSSTGSGGGYLVPVEYSNEIIELLRAKAIFFQAGPRIMPMNGTMEIPRLTGGATAGYIGENSSISTSEQTFGNLKLTSKKLAAMVPVSNDLIRNSNPQADQVVRDDIVSELSVTADLNLIRSVGSSASPTGVRYQTASGNLLNSAGTSASNIETDFSNLMGGLQDNNVGMIRPVWMMAPRSFRHLYKLRDANGNLIYPELRNAQPVLYGYPVLMTTNIPVNLGSGSNETEVYLVDFSDVFVGEEAGIELMASDVASYDSTSAFQNDQTVIRAIMKHDMALRHDVSSAVITDATWGA